MSKIKNVADEFLELGGRELGYNEAELPDLDDMYMILSNNVKIWEYKGTTEEEYYGSSTNEKEGETNE